MGLEALKTVKYSVRMPLYNNAFDTETLLLVAWIINYHALLSAALD